MAAKHVLTGIRNVVLFALLTQAFASGQTGRVPTPDVDLAYWSLGESQAGTPVIAINGGPGLSHVYMMQNDVWARISQSRPVILYDQRGTGGSRPLKEGASQSMDAQVADLDAVRAYLKFARVDLVGDSYGGLLAMAYTAAHPEHVRKLVLSDSAAPAWKDIVHLFPQVFPDKLESPQRSPDPEQGIRNHLQLCFYSEEKRDAYLKGAKDMGSFPEVGAAVRKASPALDLTPALPKFLCPTLVITGRYDMNVAPLTAWRMYKAIPGAQFTVFEKSGHLPSYEEPDKYVQTINNFLAK